MVHCDNLPCSMCVVTENVLEIKAFCRQDSTLWQQKLTFKINFIFYHYIHWNKSVTTSPGLSITLFFIIVQRWSLIVMFFCLFLFFKNFICLLGSEPVILTSFLRWGQKSW